MTMIPETYSSQPRYDNGMVHSLVHPVPRRGMLKPQRVGDRFMPNPASGTQWNPTIMPSLDPIDPFVSPPFSFSYDR